jgi:hypothetical protein
VGSWNLGGVERSRRIPARSAAAGSVVARGKKRKSSGEMGFGSGFIGEHGLVEEREREGAVTGPGSGQRAAPACPSGVWQPLGIGGPTWLSRGRPAEATRAVGEAAQRHVGEGRAAQACSRLGKRPAATDHARVAETGEIRDSRKTMEDLGAIS